MMCMIVIAYVVLTNVSLAVASRRLCNRLSLEDLSWAFNRQYSTQGCMTSKYAGCTQQASSVGQVNDDQLICNTSRSLIVVLIFSNFNLRVVRAIQSVVMTLQGEERFRPLLLFSVSLGSHTIPTIPSKFETVVEGLGHCVYLMNVTRCTKPVLQVRVHHFLDICYL